ncbi:putative sodium/phosphate symporter [Cryphonectria parasitica EP155]|uniref:Phosphate transporter n=1 Tax=Cryphonectria parasitica (strain ATCC 38755 / EP155) TaxID=660469 RepID=A0A9P4Y0H2_CRYP1|nr:putative sodium/phosphate symporter [Cryphonectria parasitica EP155]KAF3764722.1 putative sodium/phosphate symporter [Cryphonectria parasitica EP155]
MLDQYTYVFAIGTFFAMLDAYNNGANDVANAWATSVSSRSISYRQAMVLGTIFEMLGAITVGARTADTIKNGIIPNSAFQDNAGVQMLAFTCALAAASTWVMWCTRHSAHVSSTYSLISAVAGVGIATVGASQVQWGWNKGKGLGAIFAGLGMAPAISAGFGASIFMLIKLVVHIRSNPVPWAVWSSPFFFLIAGTICTLSIVYKGSPNLGLNKKPGWYVASVTMGTGAGLALLAALFFVPYVHTKIIKKDQTLKWWQFIYGPLLFKRPAPAESEKAKIPNYEVVQKYHDDEEEEDESTTVSELKGARASTTPTTTDSEKQAVTNEVAHPSYKELMADGEARFHARLLKKKGPLGWAMRLLHDNPMGAGQIYELHNIRILLKRLPAQIVVGALYGLHYDIHAAQSGIAGTPEGDRMQRVYAHAQKYPNEVEHTYSFVQILTACTASFAHGANDIGNSVGPWAVIYSAWSTGDAAASKAPVPVWQLAVLSAMISLGLITYGYNIMKVMGNKITYHSPSRGCSMEMGAAVTVLVFSQYSLPVSTSMCITGATVGVGLCNGTLKAVNFQRIGLLLTAWILTIPIAGTLGGVLMGLFLNAPHFSS